MVIISHCILFVLFQDVPDEDFSPAEVKINYKETSVAYKKFNDHDGQVTLK